MALLNEIFGKIHADFHTMSTNCTYFLNLAPIFGTIKCLKKVQKAVKCSFNDTLCLKKCNKVHFNQHKMYPIAYKFEP